MTWQIVNLIRYYNHSESFPNNNYLNNKMEKGYEKKKKTLAWQELRICIPLGVISKIKGGKFKGRWEEGRSGRDIIQGKYGNEVNFNFIFQTRIMLEYSAILDPFTNLCPHMKT